MESLHKQFLKYTDVKCCLGDGPLLAHCCSVPASALTGRARALASGQVSNPLDLLICPVWFPAPSVFNSNRPVQ